MLNSPAHTALGIKSVKNALRSIRKSGKNINLVRLGLGFIYFVRLWGARFHSVLFGICIWDAQEDPLMWLYFLSKHVKATFHLKWIHSKARERNRERARQRKRKRETREEIKSRIVFEWLQDTFKHHHQYESHRVRRHYINVLQHQSTTDMLQHELKHSIFLQKIMNTRCYV